MNSLYAETKRSSCPLFFRNGQILGLYPIIKAAVPLVPADDTGEPKYDVVVYDDSNQIYLEGALFTRQALNTKREKDSSPNRIGSSAVCKEVSGQCGAV